MEVTLGLAIHGMFSQVEWSPPGLRNFALHAWAIFPKKEKRKKHP